MTQDLVYIFDKITKTRNLLGEIQKGFNMSFVIDGTKDSARIIVYSFNGDEVEPNTVVYHLKTNTWWIVSEDNVERYMSDAGFLYIHNLQLEGAIELINARDLTDCGFDDNKYTINDFITRLFKLSNFEYTLTFDNTIDNNFLNKKVDFIKTFENYTLLSALREFLDAYNMCAKLTFETTTISSVTTITNAILNIVSKTGNFNLEQHDIDDFDLVREKKILSKESFGTCVISNAENVISTKSKTFPSAGTIRLSSTTKNVTPNNAILRLPSKVFKGNWLKMTFPINVNFTFYEPGGQITSGDAKYNPFNNASYNKFVNQVQYYLSTYGTATAQAYADTIKNVLLEDENKENISEKLNRIGAVTLYEGNKIIPTYPGATIEIKKGDDVPYLTKMSYAFGEPRIPFVFTDKETKEMLEHKLQGVAWERGSNIITGFEFLNSIHPVNSYSVNIQYTDYYQDYTNTQVFVYHYGSDEEQYFELTIFYDLIIDKNDVSFIVNYIPMLDLKIKVDNQRDKKDTQLYNQNGKLTDSVALSKLINSYSKEISSDKITRYMNCFSFNDAPKLGSIVKTNNEYYVINNVSFDFTQNESNDTSEFDYYIECEITMCKYVSTKTLLVSPNTNIREYGIPQNFNVKRKQLYRDYYELSYSLYSDANQNTPYLNPFYVFNFSHYQIDNDNYICVMKLHFDNVFGGDEDESIAGSDTWYYQLETTNYYLSKMVYIVLDFNDNNIIGYGSQNVFSGFDISRVFSGFTDTVNTPISYVDDKGEFKDIDILYCTNTQITDIYDEYQEEKGDTSFYANLYNYSIFVDSDIYSKALSNNLIRITEDNYYKDALEVPVFEFAFQVDDSADVLIGDNILFRYDGNVIYFYTYVVGDNLTQNNCFDNQTLESVVSPVGWRLQNGARIGYNSSPIPSLTITLYGYTRYNASDDEWTDGTQQTIQAGKDLAIFRHAYNTETQEENVDLMLIAKKVKSNNILPSGALLLVINHYKLK